MNFLHKLDGIPGWIWVLMFIYFKLSTIADHLKSIDDKLNPKGD